MSAHPPARPSVLPALGALLVVGVGLGAGCSLDEAGAAETADDRVVGESAAVLEAEAPAPPSRERPSVAPGEPGASTRPTGAEPSAAELIRAYTGPRIAISALPEQLVAGTPISLSARVTTSDGAPVRLSEEARVDWRVPEGWTLEGEGADVTLTPPVSLPDGDVDIGVRIEDEGLPAVRGGVLLRR